MMTMMTMMAMRHRAKAMRTTTMKTRRYPAMVMTTRKNGKMEKWMGHSNLKINIFGATRTTALMKTTNEMQVLKHY
jgi:hypothetical protein